MTTKEIPEVKAYKELKKQVDAEQTKLKDLEERREKLRNDLRKQEERVSKAEAKKRVSLEKFAINEAAQEEVNKTKLYCRPLNFCRMEGRLLPFISLPGIYPETP